METTLCETHLLVDCPGLDAMRGDLLLSDGESLSLFISRMKDEGLTSDGILKTFLGEEPPFSKHCYETRGSMLRKLKQSFMDYWLK